MAKIELADGTVIPVVKPTLWDGVEVEKETGWNRREYAAMMKFANVQTAFSIFASLRRAGRPIGFLDIMDNIDTIATRMIAQPGDLAREKEAEGEESPDPQTVSATPAVESA